MTCWARGWRRNWRSSRAPWEGTLKLNHEMVRSPRQNVTGLQDGWLRSGREEAWVWEDREGTWGPQKRTTPASKSLLDVQVRSHGCLQDRPQAKPSVSPCVEMMPRQDQRPLSSVSLQLPEKLARSSAWHKGAVHCSMSHSVSILPVSVMCIRHRFVQTL